jgi:hypothetical protein
MSTPTKHHSHLSFSTLAQLYNFLPTWISILPNQKNKDMPKLDINFWYSLALAPKYSPVWGFNNFLLPLFWSKLLVCQYF